jgi:hypothetical protein
MTLAAQAVRPVAFPIFDGVIVSDPYRFLSPPPGGEGSPTSAASTIAIKAGVSPAFAVYTSETPPQAELLAHGGELVIGAGSSSVKVTIDPIAPPSKASGGSVAGNVYRFTVTDQSGAVLALLPPQTITLALRGPGGIAANASIARLVAGAWQALPTAPSGLQDLFLTNADALGDFAVLGSIAASSGGFDPQFLILGLIVAGFLVVLDLRYGGFPGRRTGGSSAPGNRRRRTGNG